MPASIPPKPSEGSVIQTAWGADIHDRIYTPEAIVAYGNPVVGVTANQKFDISTFASGNPAFLDAANDQLVVPAGLSGLYLCIATLQVTNLALGLVARGNWLVNDASQAEIFSMPGNGASSSGGEMMAIYALADGGRIAVNILPVGSDPADYHMRRIWLVRIGNAYGT